MAKGKASCSSGQNCTARPIEGVSSRAVLPVHTDDDALLFGLKLSVIGLKRRFRDDRTPDPAFGFCEGE